MIGQIDIEKSLLNAPNDRSLFVAVASVVNSLVDAVNKLQKDYDNVCIWMGEQKLKTPADNSEKANCQENVQDEIPRCPFCGEELYYAQEIDGGFEILTCDCPAGIWLFGNDKMWYNLEKAIIELDRTRKALEIAVDGIKYMRNNCLEYAADYMDKADDILEQIKKVGQEKG